MSVDVLLSIFGRDGTGLLSYRRLCYKNHCWLTTPELMQSEITVDNRCLPHGEVHIHHTSYGGRIYIASNGRRVQRVELDPLSHS